VRSMKQSKSKAVQSIASNQLFYTFLILLLVVWAVEVYVESAGR
jgi:hypothetical protein